jgi:hypothetical protein
MNMKKKIVKKSRIEKVLRAKELWTGIIMVVAAVSFGITYFIQPHFVLPSLTRHEKTVVSPVPEKGEITKKSVITPTPSNTEFETEVKNNDSFWEISKRVCKTGKYFLVIQDLNTADPYFDGLHVGDKVKVKCSFE